MNISSNTYKKSYFSLGIFQTPDLSLKDPKKQGVSFLPSILPSVCKFSRNWLIIFFLKLSMLLAAHIQLYATEPDFLEKIPIGQKLPKMVKNGPKTGFLDFLRKPCHQFCLKFMLNESSCGSLRFSKICMLGKNLVLKLQPKMALSQ